MNRTEWKGYRGNYRRLLWAAGRPGTCGRYGGAAADLFMASFHSARDRAAVAGRR
jgi:hypothetical protein